MTTASIRLRDTHPAFAAAYTVEGEHSPWVDAGAGKSFKLLQVLPENSGFVELLRVEAGATMPLHRHTGEAHAFTLRGSRELCTGEIVGPGSYVFEPSGNVDWWRTVGDDAVEVFVVVLGQVEYLDDNDSVTRRIGAAELHAAYRQRCGELGLAALPLCA